MQSAECQMAGFSDTQRRLNSFQIAHFADQHHVRVFTEGGAQRVGKALGVGMEFALVDQTIFVHVHEFDWVLNGEDVIVPLSVDLVDHGRQSGGFARPRRSCNQHQPAGFIAKLADNSGQPKLVE